MAGFPSDMMNQVMKNQLVSHNIDILTVIVSYLNRKRKFQLREVNRDFRDFVIPRAMVSLNILRVASIQHVYFEQCLGSFKKVRKLVLEDQ